MSRTLVAAAASGLFAFPAAAGCIGQCYTPTYVAPTYQNVIEKFPVSAPRTYAIATPARYKTVYDTVQVSPGGKHWTVKIDAYGRKVGCWVSTPPRYATVSRTVMVEPPQVIPYAVPAQYGYRTYTVQTSPGYKTWAPISPAYHAGYGPALRPAYVAAPVYDPFQAPPPRYRARYEPHPRPYSPVVRKGYDRGYGPGPRAGYDYAPRVRKGYDPAYGPPRSARVPPPRPGPAYGPGPDAEF